MPFYFRGCLMLRLLLIVCGLSFFSLAQASVHYTLDGEQAIARLDGLTLNRDLLNVFLQKQKKAAQLNGRTPTLQMILQQIMDDALMAGHARKTLTPEQLAPVSRVGFTPEVERFNQQVALLRSYFNDGIVASVQLLPGHNFSSLVSWNPALTADYLQAHFSLQPGLTIDMTPAQQADAANMTVLTTGLAAGGKITLLDIYQRQNVQGRLSLLSADEEFLRDQTRLYVGGLYVVDCARQQLGEENWAALQQILLNQQQRQYLLEHMGIYADIHDDNPALRARAAAIDPQRLQAAYERHKEDYQVVERTKVRHIRVDTQALADQVVAEIRKGLPFEQAVQRYSQADDKASGGDLGWLKRGDKSATWLHAVAFIQPEGQVTAAFRSPESDGPVVYEILRIDEKEEGYLPLTDAGVRYELTHTLAREDLQQELNLLQISLRNNAEIYLNRRLQPGKTAALNGR